MCLLYKSPHNRMVRRIDETLNALERANMLTQDGRNWLVAACDPFHDTEYAVKGYPDVATASTVVQLIKKQIQIAVPTTGPGAVATGQNWDCSIAITPALVSQIYADLQQVDVFGNIASTTGVTGCVFGGLVSSAGPQGADMWPSPTNLGTLTVNNQSVDIQEYVQGNMRLIGAGFEVVNTTATLQKQGQCTAYRVPNQFTNQTYYFPATGQFLQPVPGEASRLPPSNLAQATILPGSRTWAAEEGAYIVMRQNGLNNPMTQPSYIPATFPLDDTTSAPPSSTLLESTLSNYTPTSGGQSQGTVADIHVPFDISGVHFTGLSYQTTLTVNVRWLVERMPGPFEADLVVLATPAAVYDPLALELYAKALADMPPGVMLKENPLGEWFRNVLGKVADWAPKVGGALGNVIPGAGLIGNAVGALARGGRALIPAAPAPQPLPDSASPLAPQRQRQRTRPTRPKQTTVGARRIRRRAA